MPIDYKRYPPNWLSEIRPRILRRANNRCECCTVTNGTIIERNKKRPDQWRYITAVEHDMIESKIKHSGYSRSGAIKKLGFTRITLTIAHLDNDPENWEVKDERLKALCQRCHLSLDLPHHIQNRKYGRNWKRDQTTLEL